MSVVLALGLISMEAPAATLNRAAPPGWFHVMALDDSTYAISEPKYWQQNVSYLLLGSRSALLFDTGPGVYSIRQVVESVTRLPVLVIPSHLHFDHVGDMGEFSRIGLIANERLRGQMHDGVLTLTRDQCLVRQPCEFPVTRWFADGESVDLGGRKVLIFSTPGHTPDSVTLRDPQSHRMFTGDLLNRGGTLYDVPGSDLNAVTRSLRRLEQFAREGDVAYEAHSEQPIAPDDFLKTTRAVFSAMEGRPQSKPVCLDGVPGRRFDPNGFIVILPGAADERLKPFASSTAQIEWRNERCP